MSTGEIAYLTMIVAAALVFMATLGWVSRRTPSEQGKRQETHAMGIGRHSAIDHA